MGLGGAAVTPNPNALREGGADGAKFVSDQLLTATRFVSRDTLPNEGRDALLLHRSMLFARGFRGAHVFQQPAPLSFVIIA
jgi:hypothetical protein